MSRHPEAKQLQDRRRNIHNRNFLIRHFAVREQNARHQSWIDAMVAAPSLEIVFENLSRYLAHDGIPGRAVAVAVSDDEIIKAVGEIGSATGIFAAPEGAACLPALRQLIADAAVRDHETVVLFNTGSGIKYLEAFE